MTTATPSFSVANLEKELKALWQQMARANQYENQQPVIRASVLNLIVYDPNETNGNEVSQIMSEVSAEHPGRMIVLLPSGGKPEISGWVTAQCHVSGGGRKQVCCELVMLRAEGESLNMVPSIIRPLVVPDIPVVLWWRDKLSIENRFFHTMLQTADRVIVDSGTFESPLKEYPELAKLVNQDLETGISDLNWARLGPWRLSLVRLFDVPSYRPYLNRVNRIEIAGYDNKRKEPLGQSLLLACWLASRLKWSQVGKPRNTGTSYEIDLKNGEQPLQILIRETPSPGISSVRLVAETEPTADFTMFLSRDQSYLVTNSDVQKAHAGFYITRNTAAKEGQLISRELQILGHDWVYEQALQFCASLAS